MGHYKFIESDNCKFLVEKDGAVFWDVAFPLAWGVRFGYEATDSLNNQFVLKGRLFFSRKLSLFKNDELLAVFKKERCIYPFEKVWLDSRKFVYDQENYVCSLDPGKERADQGKVIYKWSIDDDAKYDWVVASIALISIQARAHVTGVRY